MLLKTEYRSNIKQKDIENNYVKMLLERSYNCFAKMIIIIAKDS